MKPDLGKCNKLLDAGLSLVCVGENKIPNFPWKRQQTQAYTKIEFEKYYLYSGGLLRKDQIEIPATSGVGIVTGYNNVEVIDVDLKVLSSLKEQQDFWNEYLLFLRDNINDFDNKFIIYKTVNHGYHILYRCKTTGANEKLARLKGHKEAIIETRGIGGYIMIYPDQVSKKSYADIQEITEKDRNYLFEISRCYNYIEDDLQSAQVNSEAKIVLPHAGVHVWDDYNAKINMMEVLGTDFCVVRNLSDKLMIRRIGAKSPHSGYIYKDSGRMYLFSTGTIFPHEKLISPFHAYSLKYHHGDFSNAAKDLYQKGYGSRVIKKIEVLGENISERVQKLDFPIEVFPLELQNYLMLCHHTLNSSLDYMGCSMLWMLSVIIGNSLRVEVKPGWQEPATTWISVMGKAGIGKTPSINNIVEPLMKANNREVKKYLKNYAKYQEFMKLDKKEKKDTEEIKKPRKAQFIAMDITMEALVDLHEDNKNSVGVFKDELAGWFKDMNKYRAGSDLESWLMSWNGNSIYVNRKTAKSSFVDKPLIPVLGGIQPRIMDQFYTEENKDNGFIDRMLLCLPDLTVEEYNENELSHEVINWYTDYVIAFYDNVKRYLVKYDHDDDIAPIVCKFSPDAKIEWKRIFNRITSFQNSDQESEYLKSMFPKQKSYIPRFALLINSLSAFHKSGTMDDFTSISRDAILAAEKISDYFIGMAKKVKVNSSVAIRMKKIVKSNDNKSTFDVFQTLFANNPHVNKTELAEILGVSRKTVYEYIKKCKVDNQKV